jgi:hypothetical protein
LIHLQSKVFDALQGGTDGMDASTRRDYARNRKNYASDMTDAEWEKIKPYLCRHLRPRLCAHDLVSRRAW